MQNVFTFILLSMSIFYLIFFNFQKALICRKDSIIVIWFPINHFKLVKLNKAIWDVLTISAMLYPFHKLYSTIYFLSSIIDYSSINLLIIFQQCISQHLDFDHNIILWFIIRWKQTFMRFSFALCNQFML